MTNSKVSRFQQKKNKIKSNMTELIFYWFDLILSKQYKLTSFQRRRKIKLLKLQYNNKKTTRTKLKSNTMTL